VTFENSYLWRLRRKVGSDLVLMPGASVLVEDDRGFILLLKRTDNAAWCMPGGAAEENASFAETAITEVREETGLAVRKEDLIPFACVSEPEVHIIEYPNGDRTHCFSLWFVARRWTGNLVINGDESTECAFFPRSDLPEPLLRPTARAFELYDIFNRTRCFQAY